MYVVKIGNAQIRVVDKNDAKVLTEKLFDMECEERITAKLISDGEDVLEEKEGE